MTTTTLPDAESRSDPGLPLPLDLTEVNLPVVDATVARLNAAARQSGVELALEVSRVILDTFFDGDYAAYADKSSDKPIGYRALAAHPALEMSASTLQRLVRIGHQAANMPTALAEGLSPRHHRALLSVESAETRQTLAAEALQRGWSADQLDAAVRAQRPPSNAGRKALPPALQSVRKLGRVIAETSAIATSSDDLVGLTDAAFGELEATLVESERQVLVLRLAVAEAKAKRGAGS